MIIIGLQNDVGNGATKLLLKWWHGATELLLMCCASKITLWTAPAVKVGFSCPEFRSHAVMAHEQAGGVVCLLDCEEPKVDLLQGGGAGCTIKGNEIYIGRFHFCRFGHGRAPP